MAIGRGQAVAGHGADAVAVAGAATRAMEATGAADATKAADATNQPDESTGDDLIHLSWQVWPDGLATIVMHGDLDLATADLTAQYVTDIIDRHDGPVSADLSGLAFCDACGLGALIRISAYADAAGRRFELTHPSTPVTRIMRLTGVDEWLLRPACVSQ
jgi:anti-anti-sigma factor